MATSMAARSSAMTRVGPLPVLFAVHRDRQEETSGPPHVKMVVDAWTKPKSLARVDSTRRPASHRGR